MPQSLPSIDPAAPRFSSPAEAEAAHKAALSQLAASGPTVYILRGISGSGKSTVTAAIAASLPPGTRYVVCSADNYFIGPDDVYRFDSKLLSSAHEYCRRTFDAALIDRVPVIIVDNTHAQQWEYAPYVAGTAAFNDAVRFGRIAGVPWSVATGTASFGGRGALTPHSNSGISSAGYSSNSSGGGWAAAGFTTADQWHASTAASGKTRDPYVVNAVFSGAARDFAPAPAAIAVPASVAPWARPGTSTAVVHGAGAAVTSS